MSEITPFTFPTTGQAVRTLLTDDEPWFVATDVTAILGYANSSAAVTRHTDEEDRREYRRSEALTNHYPFDDLRIQSVSLINESGLYSLILRSDVLGAREFKRWVTSEVLPSIRKTGSYAISQLSRKELARMVIEAEEATEEANTRALAAEHQVLELAPAAHAWDVLASANGDYSVGDAAKILSRDPAIKTGQQRLFTTMRAYGWTYRGADGRWRAKQSAVELGRLTELPSSHYHPRTGELVLDPPTVRVLAKGLAELHKRMGGAGDVRDLIEQPVAA